MRVSRSGPAQQSARAGGKVSLRRLLYRRARPNKRRRGNMCDQDHFEHDLEEFEKRGLVTRRQFGVLVGAGVSMMLPAVVNAVAVAEQGVAFKTPDRESDAYFVNPYSGAAPGVLVWPDIF